MKPYPSDPTLQPTPGTPGTNIRVELDELEARPAGPSVRVGIWLETAGNTPIVTTPSATNHGTITWATMYDLRAAGVITDIPVGLGLDFTLPTDTMTATEDGEWFMEWAVSTTRDADGGLVLAGLDTTTSEWGNGLGGTFVSAVGAEGDAVQISGNSLFVAQAGDTAQIGPQFAANASPPNPYIFGYSTLRIVRRA